MPRLKPIAKREIRERRRDLFLQASTGQLAFPGAVKAIRHSLGMTQADFARYFGLTRMQVIELEAGRGNPTLQTIMKIGAPLGFQVGFILKGKP